MATDWHFPRRALARQVFVALTQGPMQAMALFGARRTGKTQFLLRDLAFVAAEQYGHRVAHADFWAASADPVRLLIYACDRALERGSHAAWLAGMARALPVRARLKVVGDLAGAELDLGAAAPAAPDADTARRLEAVLARLADDRRPAILMLDEFQEIARHKAGVAVMATLRAALTRHATGLRAIFTGSSRALLDKVFSERDAPFFRFATPLDLPPFGAEFVDHQLGVFARLHGRAPDRAAALAAFDRFGHQPMAFQDWLAQIGLDPTLEPDAAATRTLERIAAADGFDALWRRMPARARALARVLAEGSGAPYAAAAAARMAELLRTAPPTAAQTQAALRWLERNGHAVQALGSWALADPILRAWIAERGPDAF